MQWYCVDKMYQQKDTQTLAKAFETLFVVRVIRSTFCYDDTLTWKRTHSQAVSCGNNIVMTTEYSWIRTVVLWSHYKMLSSYCFIFHAVWVEAQTNSVAKQDVHCIFLSPSSNYCVMIGLQEAIVLKYLQKLQADFWLGTDNLVAAGVDTVTVWYGPCQHWWQLGLTSSQNQPKSFRASVTCCVCGEFVMGDCFSDGINRHDCTSPLMALEASSDADILWAHGNPFSRTQTPYWHISRETRETSSSQERFGSGGRGEQTSMTFFLGTTLL